MLGIPDITNVMEQLHMTNTKSHQSKQAVKPCSPLGAGKRDESFTDVLMIHFFVIAPPGAHQEPDEHLNNHWYFQLDKLLQKN